MNSRKVRKGVIGVSPTESGPYRDSMRVHCQSEPARMTATCKTLLGQRIISAKVLRMKELQNQLTDAHYHLNELANENRLLKAVQKRQDSALKRYEGTNAELPRIINSHQEELKVLQTKYKQLKFQHKQTCDLLKEKESEIHSLQNQNKHLLKLSKDQQLGEREKLQIQVSDLNHEIQEHHKTIQMLNRKLTLENKKFKHHINMEVTKHKETRKQLHISLEKLKKLEELLNNREKRLYSNPNGHQLPSFNRREPTTSQSLTNLRNNSMSTSCIKPPSNNQNSHADARNETLPKLNIKEPNGIGKLPTPKTTDAPDIVSISETMTSLDHVRKFRLQKSAQSQHSSSYTSDENDTRDILETEINSVADNSKTNQFYESVTNEELEAVVNSKQMNVENSDKVYRLPQEIMREFEYSSSDSESSGDHSYTNNGISPTSNSKSLHSRLIDAAVNGMDKNNEKVHSIASGVPKGAIECRIDKVRKLNSQNDTQRECRDNGRGRVTTELHLNSSPTELSNPNSDRKLSHSSKTERPNKYGSQKDRMISSHNSTSDTFNKFDGSNDDHNSDGKDLWSRLRGQLDRVHLNSTAPLQSLFNSLDDAAVETNLSRDDGAVRKNSDTSDELLRYFEIEKKVNGLKINCKTGVTMNDGSSHISHDDILENHIREAEDDVHSIEEDISEHLKQKSENRCRIPIEDNSNRTHGFSSKQEFNKHEQTGDDTETSTLIKQKLLAAMKAIDDNENVQFTTEKKIRESNNSNRSQVTENLYRGLPTHTRKRDDIIKDIFSDSKIENKLHGGCSKLH